ncbi:hypothetical protein H7I77_09750 [Mycolicibacterium novocastrense]|uniref:Uncharacterized protein n=1 Tax=Mycolicibacterium novocastrense TaxID=59813 RepID=A0AAW5SIL0_MYCNV|nr:hypothetical protein [Mycolicibacterium novocastrense]MCV7023629.1 hypothetical protein [Mycolicibacterium novocastrense]GAT07727.1 putative uncharacterized protein [Mycolicibacterium novocastrense]
MTLQERIAELTPEAWATMTQRIAADAVAAARQAGRQPHPQLAAAAAMTVQQLIEHRRHSAPAPQRPTVRQKIAEADRLRARADRAAHAARQDMQDATTAAAIARAEATQHAQAAQAAHAETLAAQAEIERLNSEVNRLRANADAQIAKVRTDAAAEIAAAREQFAAAQAQADERAAERTAERAEAQTEIEQLRAEIARVRSDADAEIAAAHRHADGRVAEVRRAADAEVARTRAAAERYIAEAHQYVDDANQRFMELLGDDAHSRFQPPTASDDDVTEVTRRPPPSFAPDWDR